METLTFLNTDIEGSTALLRRVGDDVYGQILADHHRIIRDALSTHEGREDGTAGDSFFAVFTSPRQCVMAVIDIQRALAAHAWSNGEIVKVRCGIHTGEVAENATGFVGYEVHRAARISAIGHGGQVLLSSATEALVSDSLPGDVAIRDLGSHRLKDLGRPEHIFQLAITGLDHAFPPLRSLDNPELPNNLPTSLNQFIGRESDLREVRELTAQSRLVTLTGAGGSGKTRLALQAAAELLDASGDGVWFLELAPINDPGLVASTLVATMELAYDGDQAAIDVLRKTLKDQRVVIVVDNCEHLVESVADLLEDLMRSCPKIRLIATSREPLGVSGEEVYRVRSLSLPSADIHGAEDVAGSDSVQLFVLRARSHDKSFALTDANAPLVASICRRLDGIPLAIELAAARLSSMSIDDLHTRLDQRFRLLTGGSRNALPRQQTLGAMVAWSYDLLNENERAVLRRLTVFVGGFGLSAAEAVASSETIDEWDIADILGSLVNKSLVIADRLENSLRYRLLETIRQYAADQLIQLGGESEMLDVRDRHAGFYLARCLELAPHTLDSRQVEAYAQLDLDRGNIEATFNHFQGRPEGASAILRLGDAVSNYATTRWWHEPIDYLGWALAETVGDDSVERARALLVHTDYRLSRGLDDNVIIGDWEGVAAEVAAVAHQHQDQRLAVEGLLFHSVSLYWSIHDHAGSFEKSLEALAVAQAINDPQLLGRAYVNAAASSTDSVVKKENYEKALVHFRATGNYASIARTLFLIAFQIPEQDPTAWQRRIMLLNEALANAEKIGSASQIDMCITHLALWITVSGDYEAGERMSRRSLASSIRMGRGTAFVAWLSLTMARISLELENYERAVTALGWTMRQVPDTPDLVGGEWAEEERGFVRAIDERGHAALGDATYEQLFSAGAELSLSQILALLKEPS